MDATRMTCEELRDMLELYALGVLEDEERSQVDEHLNRGCETCHTNLRDALAVNALVMASAPQAAPRAGLKRRVLAGFGVQPAGWGWLGAFAAALLLIFSLWLSVQERHRESELAEARRQVIQISAQRDRLNQAIDFLNQPETKQVNFGVGQPQPPRGNVFIHPRLGVLLIASNLPALPSGRTYEMWVIPTKTSAPRPAGLFQANDQGTAMHILSGAVDSLYAVAVSVEPEAGSQSPSTTPIIVAPVPGA
jgi:anti-sigma-K factor RskA